MKKGLGGSTSEPISVVPGLMAVRIVRLPPRGSEMVHSSRRIPPLAAVTSVAVPDHHPGTVTTVCAPGGAVTTGCPGPSSLSVTAAHPGWAQHELPGYCDADRSTAAKNGIAILTAIRDALAGKPWIPQVPATT